MGLRAAACSIVTHESSQALTYAVAAVPAPTLGSTVLTNGIRELGFLWMDEPMDEHTVFSYVRLCEQTRRPICITETAEGKTYVRAEWIKAGAGDLVHSGCGNVGGLPVLMK